MRSRTRLALTALASTALLFGVVTPAQAAPSPTDIVADIAPGAADGDPGELTVFNGLLYFTADDGGGDELYVSDGSLGSAANLNLNPSGPSNPNGLTVIGSSLYFAADDGVNGTELWVITGSSAPVMVTDLEIGAGSSDPRYMTEFQGDVYFNAYTGGTGQTLWKLDAGVVTQYPVGLLQIPEEYFEFDGYLYLSAMGAGDIELYRLDGTNPPTLVDDINPTGWSNPHNFAVAGGALYFIANDGASLPYNYELFTTDGLTVTQLTTDLLSTNGYQYFTVYNDVLYYSGGPAAIGIELGYTTAGAVPAYFDINSGPSSDPQGFTAFQGSMFFGANDGVNGYELFSLTGGDAPVLRANIAPGAAHAYPFDLAVAGNRLVFSASGNSTDWELWSFDGTTANQESVINPADDADAYNVTVFGSDVFFVAYSPATGYELYRTRIAAAGALAATGVDPVFAAGVAAALLLAGLLLVQARRRKVSA